MCCVLLHLTPLAPPCPWSVVVVVVSALLTYLVHYARSNDWICLFVPNTFAIAREGKVLIPSKTRPGMVDQPDIALDILRNVRREATVYG